MILLASPRLLLVSLGSTDVPSLLNQIPGFNKMPQLARLPSRRTYLSTAEIIKSCCYFLAGSIFYSRRKRCHLSKNCKGSSRNGAKGLVRKTSDLCSQMSWVRIPVLEGNIVLASKPRQDLNTAVLYCKNRPLLALFVYC